MYLAMNYQANGGNVFKHVYITSRWHSFPGGLDFLIDVNCTIIRPVSQLPHD